MSIITYPLNGIEYTAEDAETYLSTRTSGVFSADISIIPENMTVTIGSFLAWINNKEFSGKSVAVTEPEILNIDPAEAVLNRIDRIVLRFNANQNLSNLIVLKGSPASTPVAPAIARSEVIYDLCLCEITIKAGTTRLTNAEIKNTLLDENLCGIMRDGVTGIPTAQLQSQAENLLKTLRDKISSAEDGSSYLLRNGTTAMEANFNAGGYRVTNVKDPLDENDAVNWGYAEENYRLKGKLPAHYDQWSYCFVDGTNGKDTNVGTKSKPFKTIERAFELLNQGVVDLRIKILSPGDYYFTKSTFVSMALHIYNESSGTVNIKRGGDNSGVTNFYDCHINSKGCNWYGFEGDDGQFDELYFEGCTTYIVEKENEFVTEGEDTLVRVYPTLKAFGGFIVARNTMCGGIRLKYTKALFSNMQIKTTDKTKDAVLEEGISSGILAVMCMLNFKEKIDITWNNKTTAQLESDSTYRAYNISRCNVTFDSGITLSGAAKGKISNCIVFADSDIETALKVTDSANVWRHQLENQVRYNKNDIFSSVSLNILNGYVTEDGKVLYLSLPLSKPADSSITGAEVTSLTGKIRGVNGYVDGSSEIDFVATAPYNIWCKVFENAVSIKIEKSSAFSNAVNNTPVSVQISTLVLKFT